MEELMITHNTDGINEWLECSCTPLSDEWVLGHNDHFDWIEEAEVWECVWCGAQWKNFGMIKTIKEGEGMLYRVTFEQYVFAEDHKDAILQVVGNVDDDPYGFLWRSTDSQNEEDSKTLVPDEVLD